VLRRAAALHAEAAVALASLRAMRLVRTAGATGGEAVEPYHDRIRETIVARLSPTVLAAHHRCLARELEAAGHADAEQLALHFRGAREFEKAARYSLAAAEQASEHLAFDRAARLYQSAKELHSWEGPELQILLRKLAGALANAGLGQRAARAYLTAAEAAPSESLELQRRAAEQLLFSGHIDEGLDVLRSVLRSIGMKLAETPQAALLSLFIRRATIRLRGLQFRARSESAIGKEELTRIDACWSVSVGLSLVDPIRAKDFQTRYLLLALRAGDPSRVARAMALEVGYSATSGGRRRRRTGKLIGATFALLEHVQDPRARALGTLMNGVAVYLEGRWKEAREHVERAEQMFREHCTGVAWEMDTAQVFWLVSVSWLGEWKELAQRSRELLKRAQERGDLYAETYVRVRLSSVALAEDQPEAARREIRQAMSQWSQQGFHLPHFWALVSEVHADLYCGEGGRAWTRVNENWAAISGSLVLQVQLVLINALSVRGRAAVAAAAQETDPSVRKEILKAADHDAGKMQREDMPWSNPLAQLMRAGAAATRGEAAKALDLLGAAEKGFAASDMALHVAVTRRRRGQLLAGDEGRQMVGAADTWMSSQDIREPSRIADVLAPGRWKINADMTFN
jgi:hypothetical protein